MGYMRIANPAEGDEHITWDPENEEQVAAAKKTFTEKLKAGFKAYKVEKKPHREGKPVKTFNKNAGEYLLAPAMAGG